ncbi:MAG TPA: substrate-binding domain-containing protein [Pelobium sp.]|nr:substrate-binding domain-containing protein [Pelobium sp.]
MKEEAKLVGVKEIARRANVSIATVDRVLNNRTGVSIKTKETILAIIKELDYQPNIMARRLASKKTLKFVALIPSVSQESDYWSAPYKGIQQAASEIKDYGITVETHHFDQNEKATFIKLAKEVLKGGYNGVLLAPMFENESIEFVKSCEQLEIPVVFINSDIEEQKTLTYIGPDLYQSGYLSAHVINYLVKDGDEVLIVNVSKEIDRHHHLLRKEEGFRTYYQKKGKKVNIDRLDIHSTDYASVKEALKISLDHKKVDVVFVTNSRVSTVAKYLQEAQLNHIQLVGYDFLDQNIQYLKNGVIDFLICQKPQEQGYKGIMALYSYLVHATKVEREQFMPIDIITIENYLYYRN